jgi:hypothetical protein
VAHATISRGMTHEHAAAYLELTVSGFDDWVRRGLIPGPIKGTKRWDRKAIDLALDRASEITTTKPSAYELWKEGQDARSP